MKAQSVFLVSLLFTNLLWGQEPALRITVIAGDGASHNVRQVQQKVRVDPVVQVEDEHGKPIEGAAVAFSLPSHGPGGTFENGSLTLTVATDPQGRATAFGIRSNRLTGPYDIRVTASYQGRSANVTIAQKNISASTHSSGALGVSTKEWVIVGVSLLAIAGGVIAFKTLGSGSNPNALTVTPGTPVVGVPE